MKKYLMAGVLLFSATHGMNWTQGNAPSEDAIKAFKLLGITLPKTIKETNDLLQKHYHIDWQEIAKGNPVLDIEGDEFSKEVLEKFLDCTEENIERLTLTEESVSEDSSAVLPSALLDQETNIYVLGLLKKYINKLKEVIIFTHNEDGKKLVTDLFNETFPNFNNMRCIVALDAKKTAQSCAEQLLSEWNNETPRYMIISHWKPFNDSVKNILKGNHIGSEMQPISWKEGIKLYKNGIYTGV